MIWLRLHETSRVFSMASPNRLAPMELKTLFFFIDSVSMCTWLREGKGEGFRGGCWLAAWMLAVWFCVWCVCVEYDVCVCACMYLLLRLWLRLLLIIDPIPTITSGG